MKLYSLVLLTIGALALIAGDGFAGEGDGAYGRLRSDMALQLDCGVTAQRATAAQGSLVLRYLQSAGVYVSLMDDLRSGTTDSSLSTTTGIELRPLFLARFLNNLEQGPSVLDLSLDSLGLRAGAILSSRPFAEPKRPGFELMLSMGMPLSQKAEGPWITLGSGLRISNSNDPRVESQRFADMLFVSVSLGWQSFFDMGIVDPGDRRMR